MVDNNSQPGGVASQMTYQDTGRRPARHARPGHAGLNPVDGYGYVVSHYGGGYLGNSNCAMNGDDNSPVAQFQGTTRVVFQGRNHLIYEITLQYPREGQDGKCYQIPITIDWVFASGRSYPVYAITWDVAGSGAGAPGSANPLYPIDSRAYGAMEFDGMGNDYFPMQKVSWADYAYAFETTSSPATNGYVCMNSAWTWNTPSNGFPFVQLDAATAARSLRGHGHQQRPVHACGGVRGQRAGRDRRPRHHQRPSRGSVLCNPPGGDGIDVPRGPTTPCRA